MHIAEFTLHSKTQYNPRRTSRATSFELLSSLLIRLHTATPTQVTQNGAGHVTLSSYTAVTQPVHSLRMACEHPYVGFSFAHTNVPHIGVHASMECIQQ